MSEPEDTGPQVQEPRQQDAPPPSSGLMGVLTSMRFALWLVCAITVACVVATVLPQGSEVAGYVQRNPDAGRWLKRLAAVGLTNVFSSWWFIALLSVLGVSLVACISRRTKIILKGARLSPLERARMVGTLLVHAGLLLTLIGGAIRIFFAEQGVIQFREGEQAASFVTEDQQQVPLPFTLQLMKFEIERYAAPHAGKGGAGDFPSEALSLQLPGETDVTDWPMALGVERGRRSVRVMMASRAC